MAQAAVLQKELSTVVNEFILKRGNILNAQHLPPKLVQFVCCRYVTLTFAVFPLLSVTNRQLFLILQRLCLHQTDASAGELVQSFVE